MKSNNNNNCNNFHKANNNSEFFHQHHHYQQTSHSMSKCTRLVSIWLMLMMVIYQFPASIEAKSLYTTGEENSGTGTGLDEDQQLQQHSSSSLQQQQQQQVVPIYGLDKSGGVLVGDILDYGTRDEYDGLGSSNAPVDNNAFLNFLYTRAMLQRLRQQVPAAAASSPMMIPASSFQDDQQQQQARHPSFSRLNYLNAIRGQDGSFRKRTWKQCAFNAVSCFG